MEKATSFLRLVAALFIATSAGLRLAQNIRESLAAAEAEIKDEDRMSDAADKLTKIMERAAQAEQDRKAQH
jgi:hypothetical protein